MIHAQVLNPAWLSLHGPLFARVKTLMEYDRGGRATGYAFSAGEQEWAPALAEFGPQLISRLFNETKVLFTVVAYQGYRDGQASTDWHSDDNFDTQAILSLGATRELMLRRRDDPEATEVFGLPSGSLYYMPSGFQAKWQHAVPPNPDVRAERCSLVFRTRLPSTPNR